MTDEIEAGRLADRIESELRRLLEGRWFESSVSIARLEIGPLDASAGLDGLAREIATSVAQTIPGGTHGKVET